MADPTLEGNYPVKGLYQAIAVAAMCLQDEASTRPLIGDVVTALEYLSIRTDEDTSETDEQEEVHTLHPNNMALGIKIYLNQL